jgi:phage shock protein C
MQMNGRFLINRGDAKVMGVAAGLADYTGVDPTIIRLGFIRGDLADRPGHDPLLYSRGAARAASIGASRSFPPPAVSP